MSNIEQSNLNFINDTLTNRPKIEEKITNYNRKDKETLKTIIADQKRELETYRSELSIDCYNDLVDAYQWLTLLLDNNVI